MENFLSGKDTGVLTGGTFTAQETYGEKQFQENSPFENTNECRIIKRRKLKSRFRYKRNETE